MKIEEFISGGDKQQYEYKSFLPSLSTWSGPGTTQGLTYC